MHILRLEINELKDMVSMLIDDNYYNKLQNSTSCSFSEIIKRFQITDNYNSLNMLSLYIL
jgi:hypothetical protein